MKNEKKKRGRDLNEEEFLANEKRCNEVIEKKKKYNCTRKGRHDMKNFLSKRSSKVVSNELRIKFYF